MGRVFWVGWFLELWKLVLIKGWSPWGTCFEPCPVFFVVNVKTFFHFGGRPPPCLFLFFDSSFKKRFEKSKLSSSFSTWSLISLRTLSVTTMEKFFLFLFFHLKWSMWDIDLQQKDLKTENSSTCEIAWSDFSSSPAGPESVNPKKKYQGRTCVIMFSNCSSNSDWICLRIWLTMCTSVFLAKMVKDDQNFKWS